jgi:hypothetical protein
MMNYLNAIVVALVALFGTARAEVAIPEQAAFPLPADVQQSVDTLASASDVLVFGETHGTKEMPGMVGELLARFTKLGFGALALEVPRDQQQELAAWAKEDTTVVPRFFAKPSPDGRGNEQVLALVRRALKPPYEWKLICFDGTDEELSRAIMSRLPKGAKGGIAEEAAKLSSDDLVAISMMRDAMMAKNFAAEQAKLPAKTKVVAVCGNVHARTANHEVAKSQMKALWPSFAAVLKADHPQWQVRSINVEAFGGEYFNGGKVRKFGKRPIAAIEARATPDAVWDWELNLPTASAATFLETPH